MQIAVDIPNWAVVFALLTVGMWAFLDAYKKFLDIRLARLCRNDPERRNVIEGLKRGDYQIVSRVESFSGGKYFCELKLVRN